jgi:cell division protease FtsH
MTYAAEGAYPAQILASPSEDFYQYASPVVASQENFEAPQSPASDNLGLFALAAVGAAAGVVASRKPLAARQTTAAMLSVQGDEVEVLPPVTPKQPNKALPAPAKQPAQAAGLDGVVENVMSFFDETEKESVAKMLRSTLSSRRGIASVMAGAAAMSKAVPALAADTPWALSTFNDALEAGQVERVVLSSEGNEMIVTTSEGDRHGVLLLPDETLLLVDRLKAKGVLFSVQPPQEDQFSAFGSIIGAVIPLAILGGLFFLGRRAQEGGGGMMGPMDFGKSKSKIQMEPDTGVSFNDVAGCDESKLELTEVVDFLKQPAKFSKLGAKVPRGVLLEGPPGTGKTLLARAVAGEAGVPFISASGSEFVEMFVGVGASRIRNLFSEAKKNAPCIVFIDEIDAVGRQRAGGGGNGGFGGGNDEREQTLNQILTEMDGFEGNSGVIVLAATNRGDVLDNALLRPGRFDRRVPIPLPDKSGRLDILKVHVRGKPLAPEIDLGEIANRTIGFSGASLQNLTNEAAINAARKDQDIIGYAEFDDALDRLTVGLSKKTGTSNKSRQRLVAYHEAGHATMAAMLTDYDAVTKVTIIPRSNGAGGFTLFTPSEDRRESGLYSRKYLKGQLAVALGGRVSEELIFGKDEITTGASNDLQQVRNIARRMVTQWGFAGDELGMTAWEESESSPFAAKPTSAAKEAAIDRAVSALCEEAYNTCYSTLEKARPVLDNLAEMLLEQETVQGDEVVKLVKAFKGEPVDEPEAVAA